MKEALSKAFDASDRVDVVGQEHPATLTEPVEIPLNLHKEGLVSFRGVQLQYGGKNNEAPVGVDGSEGVLQVQYHQGGNAYITVVPLRLGKVVVDIIGRYPDSGFVHKKILLDVVPPQRRPAKLTVIQVGGLNSNAEHIVLSMTAKPGQSFSYNYLPVSVTYDGVATPITIDPTFATYRIINWTGTTSPIHVDDQTSKLTPLHTGQALVETSFGGRRNLTCVDVEPTMIPGVSYYWQNCKQLLSPGEKLGPQE